MKIIYEKTGECIKSLEEFYKLLESIDDWESVVESTSNPIDHIKQLEEFINKCEIEKPNRFRVEEFDGTVEDYINLENKIDEKLGCTYSIYGEGLVPIFIELGKRGHFNER